MFKFLRERRQREVLGRCDAELSRTQAANAQFVNGPWDLSLRGQLLADARAEGLSDHPTVKRLDFLQRLVSGLATEIPDNAVPAFVAEARALDLTETDGVKRLIAHQRMQALSENGPEVIDRTTEGHGVFLRCEVEHKGQSGRLEIRDDALVFVGEVALVIPWATVAHVANTTVKDADAIAIQEGKRRTATKFAFWGRDSDYARALILKVWERFRKA
jgi:hypothetical protein